MITMNTNLRPHSHQTELLAGLEAQNFNLITY